VLLYFRFTSLFSIHLLLLLLLLKSRQPYCMSLLYFSFTVFSAESSRAFSTYSLLYFVHYLRLKCKGWWSFCCIKLSSDPSAGDKQYHSCITGLY